MARASYLLNEKINTFNTKITLDDKSYEVVIYNLKCNIKYKDNTINIKITGNIDSPDSNNLSKLKNKVTKNLKDDINSLLKDEQEKNYNISNIINYIYLKEREVNYNTYKKSNLKIDINLIEKEKNNYD